MDAVDAQLGTAGDRERRLLSSNSTERIHKHRAVGAQDLHRPQDDAIGDL